MSLPILAECPPIRDIDGTLRVGSTGVTLETVLWTFLRGSIPEDIVDQFPSLSLADVYEVVAYYLRHRGHLDAYLTTREQQYRGSMDELLRTVPMTPLQARLDARRRP